MVESVPKPGCSYGTRAKEEGTEKGGQPTRTTAVADDGRVIEEADLSGDRVQIAQRWWIVPWSKGSWQCGALTDIAGRLGQTMRAGELRFCDELGLCPMGDAGNPLPRLALEISTPVKFTEGRVSRGERSGRRSTGSPGPGRAASPPTRSESLYRGNRPSMSFAHRFGHLTVRNAIDRHTGGRELSVCCREPQKVPGMTTSGRDVRNDVVVWAIMR
jgi:hypothetical protein